MSNIEKWDLYFLRIGREVATNSKCLSRKIGAVLVKDKSVISTGYNGAPRGVLNCGERPMSFFKEVDKQSVELKDLKEYPKICPRRVLNYQSGQGLHLCQAGHAERNALIQAGRIGVSTTGSTLYCFCGQVCKDCAIEIINAGVVRLVFLMGKAYDNYSDTILEDSGIEITTYAEEQL